MDNKIDETADIVHPLKKTDLIYQIEDRPPLREAIFVALQHLLAIFVAIITPAIIISDALNVDLETKNFLISMSLLTSGIATFIQCRGVGPFGSRLLCIQGTSFSFIGPITSIFGGMGSLALPTIFAACMASAPIEMVVSRLLKYTRKVITPLVSGIVVTMIGLSLIKVAIISCGGGYSALNNGTMGSLTNLGLAAIVFVSIVLLNSSKNRYLRMCSIIFGLIIGYVIAFFMGLIDFSQISNVSAINIPQPLKYGLNFQLETFIPAFIALGIIYFITSIEAYGDITANCMIGGESIKDEKFTKRAQGGVLADGFTSVVSGIFNSFPTSIFAQNNGIIQLTGVASRYIGYFIAGFLVLLSLFPFVTSIFSIMPEPVLGGATLLMFGTVAASGVRIIASQNINRKAVLVLAVSFACGLGVELVPQILDHMPTWIQGTFKSGIATGGLAAIVSNLVIRIKEQN